MFFRTKDSGIRIDAIDFYEVDEHGGVEVTVRCGIRRYVQPEDAKRFLDEIAPRKDKSRKGRRAAHSLRHAINAE